MSTSLVQSSTQFAVVKPAVPVYPFLSQPPPQKKRPTQPLPSPPHTHQVPASPVKPAGRPRSVTTSAISAWVANVHPGSPAPVSPQRRPSLSIRRGSISSVRVASASFLNILDTPSTASRFTPSSRDFKPDLTAVGYTSVFVHFPNTPASAAVTFPDKNAALSIPLPPIPTSPVKPARGLKRFRSLSALKSRSRSKSAARAMPSPPLPKSSKSGKTASRAQDVSQKKHTKYAAVRPTPLAVDLALAQFIDGGSMDDQIQNYVRKQAKAAGAQKVDGMLVGVGGVWQDGKGGIWRDQDEEWEYAHLLEGKDIVSTEQGWVDFRSNSGFSEDSEERRGSVSTTDSDLDPRYTVQPENDARDDLAAFGAAPSRAALRGPGMSVLAIPSRARRAAPHLRKPEFLLDSFPVPGTPAAPTASSNSTRGEGKERKRPAPLALAPPGPASKKPTNPQDPDVRKDFIDASFQPRAAPARLPQRECQPPVPQAVSPRSATMKRAPLKPSMLNVNMRGLMRAIGGKKSDI